MQVLNFAHKPEVELAYSQILRAIGQNLEHLNLKAFELKCQDGVYLVQGWHRSAALAVGVQRRYEMEDLMRLEAEGGAEKAPPRLEAVRPHELLPDSSQRR